MTTATDQAIVHSLHPYPAKFPAVLVNDILTRFTQPADTVLDPFCGSGTTLVEARIRGINAVGVDINGLACLISKVKTTILSDRDIATINRIQAKVAHATSPSQLLPRESNADFDGRRHWFQDNVANEISFLLSLISDCRNEVSRNFLHVILSSIVVRVSNQESDTRYAAINKKIRDKYTLQLFAKKVDDGVKRLHKFTQQAEKSKVSVHNADARDLSFLTANSVDCIITSPPYANTYDYYLYHKFRCIWLGLDFRKAQYNEIGSRREFSSLKKSPSKWHDDLQTCIHEMRRILKPGRPAFIVIGDSVIGGKLLKIDKLVSVIAKSENFTVREITSAKQAGHSRSFNPAFAKNGKREHLIHLEKNA